MKSENIESFVSYTRIGDVCLFVLWLPNHSWEPKMIPGKNQYLTYYMCFSFINWGLARIEPRTSSLQPFSLLTYWAIMRHTYKLRHTHLSSCSSTGSGKTTLLDVIACRTEGGLIAGDVFLNKVSRTSTMVRGCSAYVRQDDRLLPHLTVKETLMFVAQLKLPTNFTSVQIKKRVRRTVERYRDNVD